MVSYDDFRFTGITLGPQQQEQQQQQKKAERFHLGVPLFCVRPGRRFMMFSLPCCFLFPCGWRASSGRLSWAVYPSGRLQLLSIGLLLKLMFIFVLSAEVVGKCHA